MLHDGARSSRLRWNSLHFGPIIAAAAAFVDSTTGRRDYMVGITGVDINRKNIGVVDDSILDALPTLPAIS